ncbi:M-phase inducer phosphatase, putative [Entamoeba invadens IP1]|uniref:protein-tyrosine-phosphatase n=1 Tax=Entamoeba invadens IP1 TaxID=370355 RepID=A0A0A1U0H8_ENTIV|nr:M-phase inducer phosphatase, putative [Entamoeba invadens IP1]ELP87380.1 M-phase inducer phosphatase, putative [Entamoeba invadens IP1]|eukprot:XP_004254151.1 M-phase inducer phosphatase, putative [Entamoeba invadens IP1]
MNKCFSFDSATTVFGSPASSPFNAPQETFSYHSTPKKSHDRPHRISKFNFSSISGQIVLPTTPRDTIPQVNNVLLSSEKSHVGVNSITVNTFKNAVEHNDNIIVVDCRYPFEFAMGHISSAINVWNEKLLKDVFPVYQGAVPIHNIVIFYCEYSGMRAPSLANKLHQLDVSSGNLYLTYPEIYVIKNGAFDVFNKAKKLFVGSYVAMNDKRYSKECADARAIAISLRQKRRCSTQSFTRESFSCDVY